MADISSLSSEIQGLEYWADVWNTLRLWFTAATAIVAVLVTTALYKANDYSKRLAAARKMRNATERGTTAERERTGQ